MIVENNEGVNYFTNLQLVKNAQSLAVKMLKQVHLATK